MNTRLYARFNDTELDSRLNSLRAMVVKSDSIVEFECKTATDRFLMHEKLSNMARCIAMHEIDYIQREQEDREKTRRLRLSMEDSHRVPRARRTEPSRPTAPQVMTFNITILPPDDSEGGDGKDPGPSGGSASRPNLYLVE